ncbi:hypothetical protein AARAC_010528 [Aspergillus arachidicola]|uniref:Uncharacterized protein n=1 Tax=Aspergillus arachidicola TaxID=656916 RepID=A0A2G7FM74_9EURO|nr:hypothetical protein AARAC_010528 [Aspergillus arachidicola]
MGYKTNYEPYRSESLDMRQELSSEELLYPLGDLYPHVVALQLQSEDNPWSKNFPGYSDVSYWAEVSSSRPPSETSSKHTTCRYSSGESPLVLQMLPVTFANPDELQTPQPPDLSPASGDFSTEMSCADARELKLVFTERSLTSHSPLLFTAPTIDSAFLTLLAWIFSFFFY